MKALVLAGGFPQIALLEELHRRGIETILADWNSDPVAKPFADRFFQVSTLDIDAVTDVAIKERVDFVITVCTDQALLTVACVSEKLGLPCYIDYRTAKNVTNKAYMKQVFCENHIPTSRYFVMKELDEDTVKSLNYPLIVKPVDCNSSKGVRRVENLDELRVFFHEAVQMSRTSSAIIEEFFDGWELSADVYVEEGQAKLLSLSNSQKIADKDKFVIFRAVYPPYVESAIYEEVLRIAQRIADAFHISNSPMLIQFLTDGQKLSVVEFSARTGGGIKYLLIQHISGFDVIRAVVDLTLGEKPHVELKQPLTKYLINDFIYCRPGVFDHLEGFTELKSKGILKDYYLFKWKNAVFNGVNNSGDRVAGYTIVADRIEELLEKHRLVREKIRVIDVDGKDMARHELLTDLRVKDNYIIDNSVYAK